MFAERTYIYMNTAVLYNTAVFYGKLAVCRTAVLLVHTVRYHGPAVHVHVQERNTAAVQYMLQSYRTAAINEVQMDLNKKPDLRSAKYP